MLLSVQGKHFEEESVLVKMLSRLPRQTGSSYGNGT